MGTYIRCILLSSLCIVHISISTLVVVNGLSSHIAMFAMPPQVTRQQHSLSLQSGPPKSKFQFRNGYSYTQSSLQESSVATDRRNNAKSIAKIKSPSNFYTQFYKEGVLVGIESTSSNSRRISGEIIIDTPIDDIWAILTDYDNLSNNVPNLVASKVINNAKRIIGARPRVYQRGAQKIFGFEFGADVTLDMTETVHHSDQYDNMYSIDFDCVDSQFFSEFDGSWILEQYNAKTMVRYIVDVKPKGPVPVAALEWRIKEDVPSNILSVAKAAEARGTKQRNMKAINGDVREVRKVEKISEPQLQSSIQQPSNPLRQLADSATNNLKQTAKSILPSPIYSTARQAIKTINRVNPRGRQKTAPAMSLSSSDRTTNGSTRETGGRRKENMLSSKATFADVDWYEDETMATYLKDTL